MASNGGGFFKQKPQINASLLAEKIGCAHLKHDCDRIGKSRSQGAQILKNRCVRAAHKMQMGDSKTGKKLKSPSHK